MSEKGTLSIADRLRFDAVRCELNFSSGVASNISEGVDEIERLRAQLASARKALTWIRANKGAHPGNIIGVIEECERDAGCSLTDEKGNS